MRYYIVLKLQKLAYYSLLTTIATWFFGNAYAFTEDRSTYIAIQSALNEKWFEAHEAARAANDPEFAESAIYAVKIYNSPSLVEISEIIEFLKANKWLPLDIFGAKVEQSLSVEHNPDSIIKWFDFYPPTTRQGKFLLLHTQINKKITHLNAEKTKVEFKNLWRSTNFDLNSEEFFMKQYKDFLTVDDLLKKIEHLTWRRSFVMAERLINILPYNYKSLPKFRLSLAKNPDKSFEINDSKFKKDELTQYFIIEHLIKNDKEEAVVDKLLSLNPYNSPDKWWKLRNLALRYCFKEKRYTKAYQLATSHNLIKGTEFAEAEWLAGWIALQFLDDPEKSIQHFELLYQNVQLANSKSKAAYWLARAWDKAHNLSLADNWYTIAASYSATFYGQLAIAKIYEGTKYSYMHAHNNASNQNSFTKDNMVAHKIALFSFYLFKAGYKYLSYNLINSLPNLELSRQEMKQIGSFFIKHGLYPLSVELAKVSANKGNMLIEEGYPKHIEVKRNKLPKSLYLAIIRQESNFDQSAVSLAGAKGLMQVMPGTAARLAKILGLSKSAYALDAQSNVLKGVTYIDELYSNYNSFILTIAAYNAGPGNIKKWIERYGDPRNFNTIEEKIDWIESIPFAETRNYVKKVFENFIIYNSILFPNQKTGTIINFLNS